MNKYLLSQDNDRKICKKNLEMQLIPKTVSMHKENHGILLPKLFWPTVRKHCSNDWEKPLKFEAEGREFSKFLRSLEQFTALC